MRALLAGLVLANCLMFAWGQGWLDRGPMAALAEQSPERIRVVPIERLGAPGASSVPPAVNTGPADPPLAGALADAGPDRAGLCRAFSVASEPAARALATALEQTGARVDTLSPSAPSSYLVYLPPASSLGEAQRRVAALRQAGVDDVFLMPEGPLRLGISLGLFTREAGARERASQVRGLGYDPLIAPRPLGAGTWRLVSRWPDAGAAERGLQAAASAAATVQDCPDSQSGSEAAASPAAGRAQPRD